MRSIIILPVILVLSSVPLFSGSAMGDPSFDPAGSEDVPVWGRGDFWNYTTEVEYDAGLVTVDLSGWINMSVVVFTLDLFSSGDPVYITNISGNISGKESTIFGDIIVNIDVSGYLWHRAQDLAVYRSVLNATVSGTVTIINGDYTIAYEYAPPLEEYDFPLVAGDTWDVNTTARLPFGGGESMPILMNCSLGSERSVTVEAGTFDILPVLVNGEETLFYNGSVGNSIKRSYLIDIGSDEIEIPLELSEYRHSGTQVEVELEVTTEQQVWIRENFSVHGEVSISNCLVNIFFPGGILAGTTGLIGGDRDFDVTLKAPEDPDDTPTLIDHASLGVLVVVNGGEGIGVVTVTTKAQELVVEDGDLWVEQDGNGTVDDMVRIGMRINNPSNFAVENFIATLELFPEDWFEIATIYDNIPARSFIVLYMNHTFENSSTFNLDLRVNTMNNHEFNMSNNEANTSFTVYPRPPLEWNLSHDPGNLTVDEGESVDFSAMAHRGGYEIPGHWYLEDEEVSEKNEYEFQTSFDMNHSHRIEPYVLRYVLDESEAYPEDAGEEGRYDIRVRDVNRPQEITSFSPADEIVSIDENESVEFILNISEPDGDDLRYFWKVGNVSFEAFRNITLRTEYAGINSSESSPLEVSVVVFDGRDPSFNLTVNWTVFIHDVDRPPLIELDPDPGVISIKHNDTVEIGFEISDPDGTGFVSEWTFLNRTCSNVTGITLDGEELGLEGGELFTVALVIFSNNFSYEYNWTVNVTIPPVQPPPSGPEEPTPPSGAGIESPLDGETLIYGKPVLFKASADDERNLSFAWIIDGMEYDGSSVTISELIVGNHTAEVNISSTDEDRPGWIVLSVDFTVVETAEEVPDEEEGEGSNGWIVVAAIGAIILIILFIFLLLFIRRRDDSESWEE